MPKVATEVGIGAALIGLSLLVPGGFLAATALLTGPSALASVLAAAGAGLVLSGVGTLLNQKATGIATTSRNAISPWQVIYGRKKVGGTIVYQEEVANDNRILLLVVVVACHPCQEVEQVWLNNKAINLEINPQFADTSNPAGFWESFDPPQGTWQIETIERTNDVVQVTFAQNPNSLLTDFDGQTFRIQFSRDAAGGNSFDGYFPVVQTGPAAFSYTCGGPPGAGTGNPGTVTSTWPQYKNSVTVGYYQGAQTQASGIIIGNTVGYWTAQCLLTGRTYVSMKLTFDSTIYNGLPEISFVMQGKNDILDPRTGNKGYTNNAALVIADYLAQPDWGFGATYGTQIPLPQLIAAANICDEQVQLASGGSENRYACDGSFDVSVSRGEILQNLLTSCGGRLLEIGGQFIIQPAAWVDPSGAVTIGAGNTGPLMMMNDKGLVAEYYNNPVAPFVPDAAGTTQSQFVYALGLLNAFQAVGNPNAKTLAGLILSAIVPYLFRGVTPPANVTAQTPWSPDSWFVVKQPFLTFDSETLSVNEEFASTIQGGWRKLVGQEFMTSCDAYNWAMRLFLAAAAVFDGVTPSGPIDLGYGFSPYGSTYGDPPNLEAVANSGWLSMLTAIQQMARVAYGMQFSVSVPGMTTVYSDPNYGGGMVPYVADFTGTPSPSLNTWLGPVYVGFQSPWAMNQVNPSYVAVMVQFLAEAQGTLSAQGTGADVVVFVITGANPKTLSVPIEIAPDGTASAVLNYAGLNVGTDVIVGTLPSHSLTSNQAKIAWSAYATPVGVFGVTVAVMAADGSGLFNALSAVLSTTPVEGLMFNSHPQSIFPGDPHQSGNQANPFVSNAVSTIGTYAGDDTPIPNTQGKFNAVILGSMTIETAGTYQFTAYVNSAFVIGFSPGVTYSAGDQFFGALAGGTAQMRYPALAGLNNAGDWPGGSNWATVVFSLTFATAGIFQFEIDYASGLFSERQFCLLYSGGVIPNVGIITGGGSSTATGTAPSGQDLQLTPYSGGAAIGQTVSYVLSLHGLAYTAPTGGPFVPVYQQPVPPGAQTWGPAQVFGFFGPDPNYSAGYYQYRPLAELCDLIAGATGAEVWYAGTYAQAVSVVNTFIEWVVGKWTSPNTGPPNYFPSTGAQTTAIDIHCAALLLYSVLSLDLAARPTGAGGESSMNAYQFQVLVLVYIMFEDSYLASGPMAGTFCLDPTGAQDWSPIWSGEILRALSKLVTWGKLNARADVEANAVLWINGLVNFGLSAVVAVDPDLGYGMDDLRGPVKWSPKLPRAELFNAIKGTYVCASNQWQQSDFPSYAQDTIHGYIDGTAPHQNDANWDADGQRLWKDVQLPFTNSCATAQRLAKIELLRIRQQGRGTLIGLMTLYNIAPLDTIYFSCPLFKWENKVMEVAAIRLIMDKAEDGTATLIGTEIDIQEADPSVYEWGVTEELSVQGYSYVPGLQNLPPD
jgi:hypothetical protein